MQTRKQRFKEQPPMATEQTNARTSADVEQSDLGSERSRRGRPRRNDLTQAPIARSTEEAKPDTSASAHSPPSSQSPQPSNNDQLPASNAISESSSGETSQLHVHQSLPDENEVRDDGEIPPPAKDDHENRENSYDLKVGFGRGIDSIDILLEENDPFEYQDDNGVGQSLSGNQTSAHISPISKTEQLGKNDSIEKSMDASQLSQGNEMETSVRSAEDTPFSETNSLSNAHIFQTDLSAIQSERQEKTRIIPFFSDSSSLWSFETNNKNEKDMSFQTIDSLDTISEKGTPSRMSSDAFSAIHGSASYPQTASTPVNLMSEHSYLQKRKWFHQQYGLDSVDASVDDFSFRSISESESLPTTPLPRGPIYRNEGNCKLILLPWRSNYIETQFAKKIIPSTASLGPINKPFVRIPRLSQHSRSYDSSVEVVGTIPNQTVSDTDTIEGSTITSVQQKTTRIQPQRKFIMPPSMRVSIMTSYSAKDRRQKSLRSSAMKSETDEQYKTYNGAKGTHGAGSHTDEPATKELIKESYSIRTNRSQEMPEESNISAVTNRETPRTPGDTNDRRRIQAPRNPSTKKSHKNHMCPLVRLHTSIFSYLITCRGITAFNASVYTIPGISATPTPQAKSTNKIAIDYRDMRASLVHGQIRKHAMESTEVAAYFDTSKMDNKRGNVPKSMFSWKRCARHVAIAYFIKNHRSGFMEPLTYQPKLSNPPFGLPSFPLILSSQHTTASPQTNAREPAKNP